MNEQEELSDAIINFQVKHHVNDTDLAFASHLSVEKVHAMKTGDGQFTAEEVNQLYDYMSANAQLTTKKVSGKKLILRQEKRTLIS